MADYIHLLGAEQVQSAANTMRGAADSMQSAASSMDHSLEAHKRFMDDWLQRLQGLMETHFPVPADPTPGTATPVDKGPT